MKIDIFSTSDINGGAPRATFRLCEGLRHIGLDVLFHVQHKSSDHHWVKAPTTRSERVIRWLQPFVDSWPLRFYRQRSPVTWSLNFQWLPHRLLLRRTGMRRADIIHLHWIGGGFVPYFALQKFHAPIVWTIHDMWAFTGGCHYDNFCDRFKQSCGRCPQLKGGPKDLSHWILRRKRRAWAEVPITIVSPSRWLADQARRSSLLHNQRVDVIPNGIDLSLFRPIDKECARELLALPQRGKFILFGAENSTSDSRKGFQYLQPALEKLAKDPTLKDVRILIFGASEPPTPPSFGLPVHYLGRVSDDLKLAILYSAADVMIVPSVQENLANTIMESMACGTPVVAFNIGGNPDMIEHQQDGYLVAPYEVDDLVRGITWVLQNEERQVQLSAAARKKVEGNFGLERIAKRYANLYEELLSTRQK